MTNKEMLMQLPEKYRAKAIVNTLAQKPAGYLDHHYDGGGLSYLLKSSFVWSKTPPDEGHDFWNNLYHLLVFQENNQEISSKPCSLPLEKQEELVYVIQNWPEDLLTSKTPDNDCLYAELFNVIDVIGKQKLLEIVKEYLSS